LFPPACEPPVSSFVLILALPILTLNPCLFSCLASQPAGKSEPRAPAGPATAKTQDTTSL
jgi:hypothetical protein